MNSGYILIRDIIEVVNFQTPGFGFTKIPPEKFKDIVKTGKMVLLSFKLPDFLFSAVVSAVATSTAVEVEGHDIYMLTGYASIINAKFALTLGISEDYPNDVLLELTMDQSS